MEQQDDTEALIHGELSNKSWVFRLWLAVTLNAFRALRDEGGNRAGAARLFLFGEKSPFFEMVAEEMGYEPDGLRERIRESLKRAGGND